ncbi:hypothetical protein [Ovoidimarina sediminis]|uniref:hypothetical protein n=1 Tax=Ovoidimarina sediminis TaxID=3079856 RepID=UPI0029135413|nr:hypothetical protein [Rhodophyticola sp. MJ-SS7]MDU8943470.1 hypothetical protein [Rhodophyticola sp. MJ-SS7]
MRTLLVAACLVTVAAPAFADETEGHVLAFDRKDHVLVMADMTVWTLPSDLMVPADLGAGDRVHIVYTSDGDNGWKSIDALHRLAVALPPGTDGGS